MVRNFVEISKNIGCIYYGMNLDAIMDRIKEKISLDLLARVLVDIHQVKNFN